jgi:probable HAF family extracellular repeat protein
VVRPGGEQGAPLNGFGKRFQRLASCSCKRGANTRGVLNERGWVIGRAENEAGNPRAGLWRNGELIDLGTLGGAWSQASALNDRGEIVGQSVNANGELHAFLWRQGRMIDLGVPVLASDPGNPLINNSGQIAGRSYSDTEPYGSGAFLWENGELTDLGTLPGEKRSTVVAINDRGQILGMSDSMRVFCGGTAEWPSSKPSADKWFGC